MRELGATNLNLWTGSRIQKPEVHSKIPESVRNVVKFTDDGVVVDESALDGVAELVKSWVMPQ